MSFTVEASTKVSSFRIEINYSYKEYNPDNVQIVKIDRVCLTLKWITGTSVQTMVIGNSLKIRVGFLKTGKEWFEWHPL